MIKILFLIHDLSVGGAEKVLVNLVNNMDTSKFDITVISLFGGGVNEQFLSEKIHYKSCFSKMIRGNSKIMKFFSPEFLHKMFITERYDIEVSYLEGPCARIISGCQDPSTKLVSWIHVELQNLKRATSSFRNYQEANRCYCAFHQVVCVSEFVKQDFLKLFPDIHNPIVLYNTNETKQILTLMDEPVEPELFSDEEFKLVGVGKVCTAKGFDVLARIHKRLRDEHYLVHTYVLGRGDAQNEIEEYIRSCQLQDSFTFLGYQTNPYKYVRKCDLFVCASKAEGFSTAATEALIVGTPVVTTPVSGMTEMLGEHGEYGIITEATEESLYQGIKRFLDEPGMQKKYAELAKKRGTVFSTRNTIEAVEKTLILLASGDNS